MTSSDGDPESSPERRTFLWANAAVLALFVAPRIALAWMRETGYDEMFTLWTSRKPLADLFETLRHDDGPATHYLIAKALHATSIHAARLVSVVAAVAALFVAQSAVRRPIDRVVVGALFAVYPIHVIFSAEARAYALCALTVGIATVALERWVESARDVLLAVAAVAIAATAYAHYYGIFLFPLPVAMALIFRRDLIGRAVIATAGIVALYLPAIPLLRHQLPNAVPWMEVQSDALRIAIAAGTFLRVGFDGRQIPSMLFRLVSVALLVIALWGTTRAPRAQRCLVVLLVPMLGAIAGAVGGMRAYFPLKFESILSVAFVLWFFFAVPSRFRAALLAIAVLVGAIATSVPLTLRGRTFEPMRVVTSAVAANAPSETRVAATGPAFVGLSLERATTPFPAAHAVHPSIQVPRSRLESEAARLPVPLIWVGDTRSPAFDVLRRRFALEPVLQRGPEVAVIVRPRPL